MAARIHELRAQRAKLAKDANAALEAAQAAAKAAGRELTAEELQAQDTFDVQLQSLHAEIEIEERKNDRLALYGSAASTEGPAVPGSGPQVTDVKERVAEDPRKGFRSHREFLVSAMENAGYRDRSQVSDERLRPLAVFDKEDRVAGGELAFMLPEAFTPRSLQAAVGSDEQGGYSDRYGGFAVPSTLMPGLLQLGADADPTAGRTQPVPMSTPVVEFLARTDKDHSTSVSGGFTVARKAETAAAAASRGEMEKVTLRAASLFGLAYATEEILTDSPISFAAIIASGFQAQFGHHMIGEKIRGLGGDQYQGILTAPCTVSVAEESSQAANTIKAENVIKMRSRCWGYNNAIWIANHDAYPQLATMAVEIGTGAGVVQIYSPSLQEDRPDLLLGRPIFYSEYASTLGDPGDIILGNWSQYLDGLYQPLQSAESVHVRFINHERAFKFWLRNAGAPWWRSALTPARSSSTLSPFVILDNRD